MAGNVWEWCWDWISGDYCQFCATQGVVKNPMGPDNGKHRVLRGGSWNDLESYLPCSIRGGSDPVDRDVDVGFRVVCGA